MEKAGLAGPARKVGGRPARVGGWGVLYWEMLRLQGGWGESLWKGDICVLVKWLLSSLGQPEGK